MGSPDDYFAPRFTPQPSSRWREEFEELELLVRIEYPTLILVIDENDARSFCRDAARMALLLKPCTRWTVESTQVL